MKRRHRRLPNGFGQITEIKNKNLRNPYRAMITVGKTPEGKPICKLLKPQAYFKTYNEAYTALLKYNENPYDLNNDITLKELYDRWSHGYFQTITDSASRTTKSAWAFCHTLYNMPVREIRIRHIKGCIDDASRIVNGKVREASPNVKSRMKSLFNLLFDYAVEYEIADKNYARELRSNKVVDKKLLKAENSHISFTDEEIDKLWQNMDEPYVDVVLIQCYTGLRPQELGLVKRANVDLENMTITGGMKTDAGTDRVIPIHPKIFDLVKKKYNESNGCEYLITIGDGLEVASGQFMNYGKYRYRFMKILKELELNPEHKCHDPRIHFITSAKKYGVDEYAIKYIVGHEISDITEKIYTKRDIDWLHEEIRKIKE